MKIEPGMYTKIEYFELVMKYRERYCVNKKAVYPGVFDLKFLDNCRVVKMGNMIKLEALHE